MNLSDSPKVAQQTALRAAFLVDQAIQEKQVCTTPYVQTPLVESI